MSGEVSLQLKIEIIRPVNERDKVKIYDYVAVAPYSPEKMYDNILNYVSKYEKWRYSKYSTRLF